MLQRDAAGRYRAQLGLINFQRLYICVLTSDETRVFHHAYSAIRNCFWLKEKRYSVQVHWRRCSKAFTEFIKNAKKIAIIFRVGRQFYRCVDSSKWVDSMNIQIIKQMDITSLVTMKNINWNFYINFARISWRETISKLIYSLACTEKG